MDTKQPCAPKEFTTLNTILAVILLTVMLTLDTFATLLVGLWFSRSTHPLPQVVLTSTYLP
jgi:hypothetical protein